MNAQLKKKFKEIKLLVLDVDGVMTNGKIIVDDDGKETKMFDVQDGFGIVFFQKLGYKVAIITARNSKTVDHRAKDLKIHKVYQGAFPKLKYYQQLLADLKLTDAQACFIADDLTDLSVFNKVGCKIAVANAHEVIKEKADYITKNFGGQGAIREVVEMILKSKGEWEDFLKSLS